MWQPIDTAPKSGYICVGTQYGTRWSFNYAWWDHVSEEWTDVYGDQALNPHVWCHAPTNQSNLRDY